MLFNTDSIERAILACLVLDFDKVKARALYSFKEDDFTSEERRKIFRTLRAFDANGKRIDAALVLNELANDEAAAAECRQCLTDLTSTKLWPDYLSAFEKIRKQRALAALQDDLDAAVISGDTKALREKLEDIEGTSATTVQHASMDVVLDGMFDNIKSNVYKAIPTGLAAIDELTDGGFLPQTLVNLGAEPGAGKTTLAMQIAESMAAHEQRCLYINLEMPREQLIARSLSRYTFENSVRSKTGKSSFDFTAMEILRANEYLNDEQFLHLRNSAREWEKSLNGCLLYNPDINGRPLSSNLDDILDVIENEAEAARAAGRDAPHVFIDYLQILTGKPGEDGSSIVKRAVKGFKDYAIRYGVVVVCIMAQSRSANEKKTASLAAGRDTSSIEYSADLQLQLIHADADDYDDKSRNAAISTVNASVTKNRFGRVTLRKEINDKKGRGVRYSGGITLEFDKRHSRFIMPC